MVSIAVSLVVAFICGSLGARIAGRKNGCLGAIILGFIGSYIGQFIAEKIPVDNMPLTYELMGQRVHFLWNIIGAFVFVALQNLIFGPPKKD